MRLPLLAVAPPAALTISVIQRCQMLTPQSHSPSPSENIPIDHRSATKPVFPQSDEADSSAPFDSRAKVGDCSERWPDYTDFREHAIRTFSRRVRDEFVIGVGPVYL